jgi:hypothetical protein
VPNPSRTPLLKTAQSSFKAGRFYNVLQMIWLKNSKEKSDLLLRLHRKNSQPLEFSIFVMRLDRINDAEKERYLSAGY